MATASTTRTMMPFENAKPWYAATLALNVRPSLVQ